MDKSTWAAKIGLAEMLKGGVIMDVVNAEQAKIAEDAGAVAVMALERVPADIRRDGGVARMADPTKIREIQEAVTIPVMRPWLGEEEAQAAAVLEEARARDHRRLGKELDLFTFSEKVGEVCLSSTWSTPTALIASQNNPSLVAASPMVPIRCPGYLPASWSTGVLRSSAASAGDA